ncbi:MAG: hypothetical protein V1775_12210 [Bacteroidota bacterium]
MSPCAGIVSSGPEGSESDVIKDQDIAGFRGPGILGKDKVSGPFLACKIHRNNKEKKNPLHLDNFRLSEILACRIADETNYQSLLVLFAEFL